MKMVAYAARRYEGATRKAVGRQATLLTCPPVHNGNIESRWFAGADLVVFNLHGLPGSPVWFGGDGLNDGVPALKADTLAMLDLSGAGVFAVNCHLGNDDSPMREALLAAGAAWVVGGEGVNYGGLETPAGADILLCWFVRWLKVLKKPEAALSAAKTATRLLSRARTAKERAVAQDTLAFRLWKV